MQRRLESRFRARDFILPLSNYLPQVIRQSYQSSAFKVTTIVAINTSKGYFTRETMLLYRRDFYIAMKFRKADS